MAAAAADGTGYDAASDAAHWSARYQQYATRAAGQSARAMELYQSVMAHVSRGELAPTVFQDLLPAFVQARAGAYTRELAEVSTRFLGGLVKLGAAYSNAVIEAIAPGIPTSPRTAAPELDASNWTDWFQRLIEYAGQQGASAIDGYRTLLDRVASGQLAPAQFQQASSRFVEQRLPGHLRELVGLSFDLLEGLDDVRNRYAEEYLAGVLATARRSDEPALFAVDLTAPVGGMASASLVVTNTRAETSEVRCTVTDVRRSDGVGPAFQPRVAITPEVMELASGQEASIAISLVLADDQYEAGPLYVGAVHVSGHDDSRLVVPLRIRATPPTERGSSAAS